MKNKTPLARCRIKAKSLNHVVQKEGNSYYVLQDTGGIYSVENSIEDLIACLDDLEIELRNMETGPLFAERE